MNLIFIYILAKLTPGYMKKILLPIIVCLPLVGFGQTQTAAIDLKLDQVAKERQKERDKAEKYLIIGGALSAAGMVVGLVGPELIKEPVDPTPSYLREVK